AARPSAPVLHLAAVSAVDVGGRQVCAIAGGTLSCWGRDGDGGLGNGDQGGDVTAPSEIKAGVGVVGTGRFHTCIADRVDGAVSCTGRGEDGQNGSTELVARVAFDPVSSLSGAAQLAAGFAHSCARLQSGEVRCWGRNNRGRLGNGETSSTGVPVPEAAALPCSATDLAAGGDSTCALCGEELWCWGSGSDGRLGDGTSDAI